MLIIAQNRIHCNYAVYGLVWDISKRIMLKAYYELADCDDVAFMKPPPYSQIATNGKSVLTMYSNSAMWKKFVISSLGTY